MILSFYSDSVIAIYSTDINKDGKISKAEVKETVLNIYKERKALAAGLSDSKTVVRKLDIVFSCMCLFLLLFVWLSILNVDVTNFFLTFSSFLLAFTFIFGNSMKEIYESVVFLFVTHPFDVQDRVIINNEHYFVTEIHLLNTILMRWDGMFINYPNAVLSRLPIANARRSPDMFDMITLDVHISTPVHKLRDLEKAFECWLAEKSLDWYASPMIFSVTELNLSNKLTVNIGGKSHFSWQDGGNRWRRRTEMVLFVKKFCEENEINYYPPEQLVHAKLHYPPAYSQTTTPPPSFPPPPPPPSSNSSSTLSFLQASSNSNPNLQAQYYDNSGSFYKNASSVI